MRDLLWDDPGPELIHYEEFPVTLDRTRTYDQQAGRMTATGKPSGLWVSVRGEDDWRSWCEAEEFHLDGLACAHRVTLSPAANVLWIVGAAALDEFHLEFSHETDFERKMAERRAEYDRGMGYDLESRVQGNGLTFSRNQWPVDWARVAKQWDGIIIAPYIYSRRFDGPFWYYGVDCASGCIWNLDAIDTFELIEEEDARGVEADP